MNFLRTLALFAVTAPCVTAFADVTVQEQVTLNLAIIKAHGTTTSKIVSDKERSETDFRCDGFMSMLCGKNQGLKIVRLDRDVTWSAEPKKKLYTEVPFPTPAQRRAMEERMRAELEKLKSCPAPAPAAAPGASPGVDPAKCQLSAPKMTINKTDDVASMVGHSAHRTILNMTQSCAVKDSPDVCDMSYTFDVWLTSDDMPELADRRSFDRNYLHKIGLGEDAAGVTPEEFKKFLAPYADAMKQLGSKTSELKGYPLKTTFRLAVGGPHCSSSAGAHPNSADSPDGASAASGGSANVAGGVANAAATRAAGGGVAGYLAGSTASAFGGKLIGGLFAKKNKPDASQAGAAAAPPVNDGLLQVVELSVEMTGLNTGAIPAAQFEMPADWKKVLPEQTPLHELPNCPKTAS